MAAENGPPYVPVELYVEAYRTEVDACSWCGALVPEGMKDNHARWHESIREIAARARSAAAWTEPMA